MKKIKSVFGIAAQECAIQAKNPMWLAFFVLLLIFYFVMTRTIKVMAAANNLGITPWLLPVFASASGYSFYNGTLIVMVIAESPFMQKNTLYLVQRSGYVAWSLGKMLYLLIASAAVPVIHFFAGIISIIPYMSVSGDWGKVLYTAGVSPDILWDYGIAMPYFDAVLVQGMNAVEAEYKVAVLFFLYTLVCGLFAFYLNGRSGSYTGTVILLALVFVEQMFIAFRELLPFDVYQWWPFYWLNPVNILKRNLPFGAVYAGLAAAGVLLAALVLIAAKKKRLKIIR